MSNPYRDKLLTISVGSLTKDKIREWKSEDGERHKETTDELNNTVTQHAKGDRQDVMLRPKTVRWPNG